jgi:hypothetical protein
MVRRSQDRPAQVLVGFFVVLVFGVLIAATISTFGRVDQFFTVADKAAESKTILEIFADKKFELLNDYQRELLVRAALEVQSRTVRYAHVNAAVVTRMWTRILGFLSGTTMCVVGCLFILAKIKEARSELTGEAQFVKISVVSASPGLVLAALGTLLLAITLTTKAETDLEDGNLYLKTISEGSSQHNGLSKPRPIPAPLLEPDEEMSQKKSEEKK